MMHVPIQSMVERIAADFDPQRIILFGSQASGTADEQSDVDLLVVTDYDDRMQQTLAIRRSLDAFRTPCDIIVKSPAEYDRWRRVVNTIAYVADRYGRVVYER